MSNLAIWWLSQEACEAIYDVILASEMPQYIRASFLSRMGRPGRGRLWVDDEIDLEEIIWDDNVPLADAAGKCGGIVIRAEDARLVAYMPGFVTDLSLQLWKEESDVS